jgi:hypothetical protein
VASRHRQRQQIGEKRHIFFHFAAEHVIARLAIGNVKGIWRCAWTRICCRSAVSATILAASY